MSCLKWLWWNGLSCCPFGLGIHTQSVNGVFSSLRLPSEDVGLAPDLGVAPGREVCAQIQFRSRIPGGSCGARASGECAQKWGLRQFEVFSGERWFYDVLRRGATFVLRIRFGVRLG